MSESITNFSERNTQKFREVAIKAFLCSLTYPFIYLQIQTGQTPTNSYIVASISVERTDIWGVFW